MEVTIDWDRLRAVAAEARARAAAPYSQRRVGAAGLYAGCTVENAASLVIHAEWALVAAATLGGTRLVAMACVVGEELAVPCGICRQVLSEHAGGELWVATGGGPELLERLLPFASGPGKLAGGRDPGEPHGDGAAPAAGIGGRGPALALEEGVR